MSPPESPSDDHVELDARRIINTLDRHDVDYVLVGGLAAIAHGATKATNDLDALARRDPKNLARLADALNELGARIRAENLPDEVARDITPPITERTLWNAAMSTWRTDAGDIDILTELPVATGQGLTFDEVTTDAVDASISDASVRVAALDSIIASKRHANRGKDQAALPELDRLARQRYLDRDPGLDLE